MAVHEVHVDVKADVCVFSVLGGVDGEDEDRGAQDEDAVDDGWAAAELRQVERLGGWCCAVFDRLMQR